MTGPFKPLRFNAPNSGGLHLALLSIADGHHTFEIWTNDRASFGGVFDAIYRYADSATTTRVDQTPHGLEGYATIPSVLAEDFLSAVRRGPA